MNNDKKKSVAIGRALLSGPYLIWMIGFTIIPLALIFWYGITTKNGNLTLANITAIMSPDHWKALWLSLGLSLISTVLCLVLAYPLAMILRGRGSSASGFIVFIFILPMWMNFLLRTMAWQTLLERNGVINGILAWLHLPKQNLINTPAAIVLGMVYNFLPFMILQIQTSLCKMDTSLLEASADLGASPAQTFRRITLPLSLPGVINGITLVFLPAVSSFFIPKLLGGGQYFLIGNMIENQFITVGEWNFGSAISMIMAVIMMLLMMAVRKTEKRNAGGKEA